uniref:Uncharacterized protein n=1 Tax=Cyprinus carpio TaxID=7962 RepID=A0A8C1Y6W1_CYPCA
MTTNTIYRPKTPTVITITGFSITWGSVKRSMASRMMVKQSAVRNTALTSAPITSARIQPNVFLLVDWVCSAKRTATSATTSSDSIAREDVTRLTTTSTMKKPKVSASMHRRRTRFGRLATPTLACDWLKTWDRGRFNSLLEKRRTK